MVAAAFGDSPYATYTKVIHAPEQEGEAIRVVLSGMREVNQVEICAVNRLRKRIVCLSLKNVEWINTISLRLVECFSLIPGLD